MIRPLRLTDVSLSPLARELELLRRLQAVTPFRTERLRLIISGRQLFLDGFVASVNEKFQVEEACRALAPESNLVNRLRVASTDERRLA